MRSFVVFGVAGAQMLLGVCTYGVSLWRNIQREWLYFLQHLSFVVGDRVKVKF